MWRRPWHVEFISVTFYMFQIYSDQTTVGTLSSNSSQSQSSSTPPNPANVTTKAADGALQSTASLFVLSFSLLYLYC